MNHYLEVDRGDDGECYFSIHTGTRRLGLRVAGYYQNKAIAARDARRSYIADSYERLIKNAALNGDYLSIAGFKIARTSEIENLPENDLCYIEGQDMEDYLHDMDMLIDWAASNHRVIAHIVAKHMGWEYTGLIRSIHNYVDTEHHIIRKGAIAAYENQLGVVPLNMKDGVLILSGKGNENWLFSLPHGAGRILSRGEARRTLDLADYEKSMEGIYTTSVCSSTIDEAPDAYKPAELIEQAIGDNAEIIEHIYPIYNFKAKN